ncbi:hypothetical protein K445DRAFT_19877 [Daldinia sp. EC12]|nr:hypothetical protein K445DRAFT_19877 [Daldinia sp. EC12]
MGPKRRNVNTTTGVVTRSISTRVQDLEIWVDCFGTGELGDWQDMMRALGFEQEFMSKNQCRKALKYIWVNITDFLFAVATDTKPHFFANHYQLARYTLKNRKFFPKRLIPKGSPLRELFSSIIT